jgi:hypothetical protein
MSPKAFVTLHDVAPAVLDGCTATLDTLRARGVDRVTLLVVPGSDWSATELAALRRLEADGYELAGHGWSHRAPDPGTLYHRVHAAVLSRDEAEHLSRSRAELQTLVARCHAWFGEAGLEPPSFYVPPAWALGQLSRADLDSLPFRYWETLTGVYDARRRRFRVLPLVGYLADTRARARALRATNAFNRGLARLLRRPLRISIHPPDLDLHLAADLLRLVEQDWRLVGAADIFADLPGPVAPQLDARRGGPIETASSGGS